MLSRSTLMVLIVAALAGLVVAWGVRMQMVKPEVAQPAAVAKPAAPEMLKVPLATGDLPAERVVNGLDIAELAMTKAEFKKRFPDVNIEKVLGPKTIANRRLKTPIKQGHPFLTTDFYLEGTRPPISGKLQAGFRAIRVEVPVTREAGVQQGMFVDVLFRANARPAKAGQPAIPEKTVTILRHIEVLEAEHQQKPGAKGRTTADGKPLLFTLAVPEAKADVFGVIAGRGELWLVPTPSTDKKADGAGSETADASTLAGLLGVKPKAAPPAPFETAVYRRGRMEVNEFVNGKFVTNHRVNRPVAVEDAGTSAVPPKPESPAPAAPEQQ